METPKLPQPLSSIISGQPSLKPSPTTASSEPAATAEVDLDDDETALILLKARQEKARRQDQAQRDQRYWNHIHSLQSLTAAELKGWLLTESARFDELGQNPRYVGPEGFVLDSYSTEIFDLLCQYFTADPQFELAPQRLPRFAGHRFSLGKGIALIGPPGVGKTQLLKLFCDNPRQPYTWTPCKVACESYESQGNTADGNVVFDRFCQKSDVFRSRYRHGLGGRAFDDLGVETIPAVLYNKKRNLMLDIMERRYDAGADTVGLTHISTNLTADQIGSTYGVRLRSRFREMFNMIVFDPTTPDRRE